MFFLLLTLAPFPDVLPPLLTAHGARHGLSGRALPRLRIRSPPAPLEAHTGLVGRTCGSAFPRDLRGSFFCIFLTYPPEIMELWNSQSL